MAIIATKYLATQDVAQRTGFIESRYRTKDGRFIINHSDLQRVVFTTEEILNGISDKVTVIDGMTANTLAAENGYTLGLQAATAAPTPPTESIDTTETPDTNNQEEEEETENE